MPRPSKIDKPAPASNAVVFVQRKDAARNFDVSEYTISRWMREGKLPPYDYFIGGRARGWHRETLDRAARGEPAST